MDYFFLFGVLAFFLGGILLVHMIQQVFEDDGLIWGLIATLYPVGTYIYCKRHWENLRGRFYFICVMMAVALSAYLISWFS